MKKRKKETTVHSSPPPSPLPRKSDGTVTMPGCANVLVRPTPFTVQALLVMGRGLELDLPLDKWEFTVGRGTGPLVDVHIPGPTTPVELDLISKVHAMMRHVGHKLRIQDLDSKNGTYHNSVRLDEFEVSAGEIFRLADIRFLLLDGNMRILRWVLSRYLGFHAYVAVDEALEAVIAERPLVFVGPGKCELDRLASDIHAHQWRRSWEYVPYERPRDLAEAMNRVKKASRGTLFIDLNSDPTIWLDAVDAMLSQTFHVRPIVYARTSDGFDKAFKTYARRFHLVEVPALRRRKGDLSDLLSILLEEHGHGFTAEALDRRVLPVLRGNAWPNNMEGLRLAARNLGALHEEGGVNRAAKRLGMAPATISSWLTRTGLSGIYKRGWFR